MVKIKFSITINEFIASTDSIVEILLNGKLITSLNSKKCSYINDLTLREQKNYLIIRRKYESNNIQKVGVFKQILSSLICFFLFSSAFIEPFECLCECEEKFEITFNKDVAKMEINCFQKPEELYPYFKIKCKECEISSHKTLFVSSEELYDTFRERIKMIQMWDFVLVIVFLLFIIPFIIHMKIVEIIFSTVIFFILLLCSFYAMKNLKKQMLAFKEKYNGYSL